MSFKILTLQEDEVQRCLDTWELYRFSSSEYKLWWEMFGPSVPYHASYKGPATGFMPKLVAGAVTLVTDSIYSHCETVVGGIGLSSSEWDGGVRAKQIDFNDGKWDLIPMPWISIDQVKDFYKETHHLSYDLWGLRYFLNFQNADNPRKVWCSEWCAGCYEFDDTRIAPGELHELIKQYFIAWLKAGN